VQALWGAESVPTVLTASSAAIVLPVASAESSASSPMQGTQGSKPPPIPSVWAAAISKGAGASQKRAVSEGTLPAGTSSDRQDAANAPSHATESDQVRQEAHALKSKLLSSAPPLSLGHFGGSIWHETQLEASHHGATNSAGGYSSGSHSDLAPRIDWLSSAPAPSDVAAGPSGFQPSDMATSSEEEMSHDRMDVALGAGQIFSRMVHAEDPYELAYSLEQATALLIDDSEDFGEFDVGSG